MNYLAYLLHLGLMTCVLQSTTYTVEFTDIIAVRTRKKPILYQMINAKKKQLPFLSFLILVVLLCWICNDLFCHRLRWHFDH
jgi:hypothetical protein